MSGAHAIAVVQLDDNEILKNVMMHNAQPGIVNAESPNAGAPGLLPTRAAYRICEARRGFAPGGETGEI